MVPGPFVFEVEKHQLPAPDGVNLVTSYVVDDLGRLTEKTNPNGTVDYFVYNDALNEVREYDGWSDGAETGPTKVMIDDLVDGYEETLTMTASPTTSDGVPTGAESIADVQSLTRTFVTVTGVEYQVDSYFNLGGLTYTSGSMGSSGTNYYETQYGYDDMGNLTTTIDPQGTISITVFDGQGRKISTWVGTDDTPESGSWSPTNNTSPSNMVETESFVYDGGNPGDSDLTQVTQYPGGGAADRVTDYYFNWRDQQIGVIDGVTEDEDDGVNRALTLYTYDNLGEVTETQVYSADSISPSFSDDAWSFGDISSDLQAQTVTSYDSQGRVYQTQQYSVDPATGDVSEDALTTNYYYDADGNLIATSAPGGLWTKFTYDGAGRQVMEYQTDGHSGTSYSDADSVSDDVVLSQTQTVYDGDGNVIETITSDRFNTDSSTCYGALGTPTSGIHARVYYTANYYDQADRLTSSVNVGTNGGDAWSILDDVPDSALVTDYAYVADAVQVVTLTGTPTGGSFTLTFGGDTTSSIAYNASAATVQSDLAALASIDSSDNVVVTQEPDGGWQVRFTGSLAGTYQSQMTATSSLTGGTSPAVSVSTLSLGGDNGNVIDTTDPKGIDTRDYYNSLGRVVQTVQDFTTGAVSDSSNKTTDYSYNSVGMTTLTAVTLDGSGNQVGETTEWVYGVTTGDDSEIDSNDIVGVTEQPNPSTGLPDASLETTVTVDALGETLTSTDPDGTTHTYIYDVLGQQIGDAVTTLGSGVDDSVMEIGTSYTTLGNPYTITSYASTSPPGGIVNEVEDVYNGLDQLAQQYQSVSGEVVDDTPSVQYIYNEMYEGANNSRLTEVIYPDGYTVDYNYASGLDNNISRLTSLSDDTGTLESYKYLGLDTIVEWDHPETDINLTYIGSGTGSGGDQYTGLDQFGRVIEQNWYDTATSRSVIDLQYGYDKDGNVLYSNNVLDSSQSELYGYDYLGQLTSFEQGELSEDNTVISSPSVNETWSYDPLGNHINDSTGLSSTFNFDNQIVSVSSGTLPTYDSNGNMTKDQNDLLYTYDAWGRLVKVENSSDTVLETYSYDGLDNRMTNTVSGTTTNFYYSTSGQVLEEQANATGYYSQRYVWSPNYVNEMIDRDTSTSGSLTSTGSSFTRVWALQDANYNVVAIATVTDSVSSVVERYRYDPFGTVTVLNPDYTVEEGGTSFNWVYEFQGGRLDTITGDTHFGARDLNSTNGSWTSEDPNKYAAGDDDLYRFVGNNSIDRSDSSGFQQRTQQIYIAWFYYVEHGVIVWYPVYYTEIPGSTLYLPGSTPSMAGSTPTMPGSTPNMAGSSRTMPGSTPNLPGSTPNMAGSSRTMPGSTPNLPGSTPTLPGSSPRLGGN